MVVDYGRCNFCEQETDECTDCINRMCENCLNTCDECAEPLCNECADNNDGVCVMCSEEDDEIEEEDDIPCPCSKCDLLMGHD